MSLTQELKDPHSQASIFMRQHFPNVRRVMALSRGRMGESVETHRPIVQVPWALIGTAFDYRLRFYFPQVGRRAHIENLVCYSGAAVACGGDLCRNRLGEIEELTPLAGERLGQLATELAIDFFDSLGLLLKQTPPHQRRLAETEEETLLRYCVVMAALDFFFRAGFDSHSILLTPKPKETLAELLCVAEKVWLDDLRTLSWTFYDAFHPLLLRPAVLNPTFDGSTFVGGADADLIVGDCLIDIKTTINPLKDSEWIYQLLGYALLDWHDEYHIREVAVYFSRQRFLLQWPLNDLIAELSGNGVSDVAELRQGWHDAVAQGHFGPTGRAREAELATELGYVKIDGKWK